MNEIASGDTIIIKPINDKPGSEPKEVVEEYSIDLDDLKDAISEMVRETVSESGAESTDITGLTKELENIKIRLQKFQHSTDDLIRDNGTNITALHKSNSEMRDRLSEISQSVAALSKVSDSVFDLKNAQVNTKKAIESTENAINALKKRITAATAIFTILAILIIVLQIIALLS